MNATSTTVDLILILLDDGDVDPVRCTALGNDLFLIDEPPQRAYGLSRLDVVQKAGQLGDRQVPVADTVVRKSGHSTYRVILDAPSADPPAPRSLRAQILLTALEQLECGYTSRGRGPDNLQYAIDVPNEVSRDRVEALLSECDVPWERADPLPPELDSPQPLDRAPDV